MKRLRLVNLFAATILTAGLPASAAIVTTGAVDPDPPVQGSNLRVGYGAPGTLEIDGGSTFSTGTDSGKVLFVGVLLSGVNGSGQVLVTGAGSEAETYDFTAGINGEAHVTVEAGGLLNVAHDLILNNWNDTGNTLLFTGQDTLVTVGHGLSLNNGSSLMTLTVDDHAILRLSGSGPVGVAGTTSSVARISVSNGASLESGGGLVRLGGASGSNATVALDQGGSFVSGNDIIVGSGGTSTGTLSLRNGSSVTCQHYLRVGDGVGATGALSLEGGSSVTTSNLFAIGVGTDSHGSVTIDGGSTMDVHGMLQMGINSGTAAGTLDLIDGTLDVGNGMIAGLKGKANVSIAKGSTITVPVNGLIIANTASSEALVNFELGHDSMGHPISGRITPYQLLIRSGSKTLSLSFDSAETFRPGDVFTLIDYDDSNWDGNVFDNIGDGGTLTVGGHDFRIDYAGLIGAGDYAVTATVLGPSPITDVSPDIGPVAGGQTVTLTGSGFTNVTDVAFGGISAPSFTVDGDTSITATTPAHPAATVDVTVTTPGGGGTASNAYTFVPSPTIASVSPDIGPVEGGTIVTITGTDLALASDVTFGGVPAASFTVTSDTTITAVTPPHARGTVDVAVTGPGGTATLAGGFTYAGVLEIPTLGGWMLLLFGGLLAAAGALKLRP